MPLFTVVIPTRNRADLVAMALASVAAQDGGDVEIIVSDNSTSEEAVSANRDAVERLGDARVRLIRPPEPLGMPDHWEFATAHATGEWLLILTDRFVMRPGTLAFLRQVIAAAGEAEILVWLLDAGLSENGVLHEPAYSGRVRSRPCQAILREFADSVQWRSTLLGSNSLPRGLNSAVRRRVIDGVRARHGRIYAPLSPDYTSAFHQLAACRTIVEIDAPLYVAHGNQSNGASIMRTGVDAYTGQFGLNPFEGCRVPIDTVVNTTIRDYLWVRQETGAAMPDMDPAGELLINWRECQIKDEMASPMDVAAMRRAILASAATLPEDRRRAFAEGRALIDARETLSFRLRNRLARLGLLEPAKRLARMLGRGRPQPGQRHADVLAAIRAVPLRLPDAVTIEQG